MEEKTSTKEKTQALFIALQKKYPNFLANDFKWVLGTERLEELGMGNGIFTEEHIYSVATLFGIPVEVDVIDPYKLQLLWDITDKIESDL